MYKFKLKIIPVAQSLFEEADEQLPPSVSERNKYRSQIVFSF